VSAREKVEQQHGVEQMVMGMEELYYDVLGGGSRRGRGV